MYSRNEDSFVVRITPRSGVTPATAFAILLCAGLFSSVTFFGIASLRLSDRTPPAINGDDISESRVSLPLLGQRVDDEVVATGPVAEDQTEGEESSAQDTPQVEGDGVETPATVRRPTRSHHQGQAASSSDSRSTAHPAETSNREDRPPIGDAADPLGGIEFGNGLDA